MQQFSDPLSTLRGVEVSPRLIEDERPLTESLEWKLSELYWNLNGTHGFVESRIPYTITSSGTLSANAARLLFANCCEHPPEGGLTVLETGAGTGLFARLFIEEFARICSQAGKPFAGQLRYYVTDRSCKSREQWRELALFGGLPAVEGLADACDPLAVQTADGVERIAGVRAVFCNYSLDSLPAAVLRKGENGPEELCIRTHLTGDSARVQRATRRSLAEIRELAGRLDPELISLLPLLEFEAGFRACDRVYPYLEEALTFAHDWPRVILNHGAIACLEKAFEGLDPFGFVLLHDYGLVKPEDAGSMGATQRFGGSAAIGLNFPFLSHHFSARGMTVLGPEFDDKLPIHPRLLSKTAMPATGAAFREIFEFGPHRAQNEPQEQARQHIDAGRFDAAKKAYETALVARPRDWVLLGEIAEFLIRQVADYKAGLDIANAALAVNPWYSTWLWNVRGDALYALERFDEAHDAYLKAAKMDPADVRTNLNLAYSHAQLGDNNAALEAIVHGLANDTGVFRDRLLEKQLQILTALRARQSEEQEWLARRAARINDSQ